MRRSKMIERNEFSLQIRGVPMPALPGALAQGYLLPLLW